jgi:hypothetical protein
MRIRVSRIRIRIRFNIEVNIQELWWLKMEPWRVVDAIIESADQWLQICIAFMRSRILIRIELKVKGLIRIRI